MESSTFTFTANDGLALHVYRWLPSDAQPHAVLQIAHGMAEHAGRYARLAEAFTNAGYAVYAHDHRGHGKSVPRGEAPGHMANRNGWNKAVDDVYHINRHIAGAHPGLPIILLGHSMGSFMSQQFLYEHPFEVAGVALSGSNGKPPPLAQAGRVVTRAERQRLGKEGKSELVQNLSFGEYNKAFVPNRTEFDWLSRDNAEVDKYVADPLCGFICSIQMWVDMLDALDSLSSATNQRRIPRDKPVYVFSGSSDPVGEMGRGVQRLVAAYRAAGLRDVTCRLYAQARHEILNETNRDEVTGDLLQWCNNVIEAQGIKKPASAFASDQATA